ncbi:chain length determinant family protein [Oleiphilus messinensis]|uniref:Chain length determinant family protein n=1 Tax=Oleiphilus messinensis TaxID=141451 RepID=A0A1Y0I7F3_9GAMM|nr:XrtA system polysaccharide chain length determinant [Oleiphilus messinensis]ARU56160.1 chain length determinant family protein [Oleiphilus messinensis]
MQDVIDQIFVYLKGIWLKRIFIVLAIWAICPLGWYAVWKMPDQYASKAQVYVDTQSLLRPLLRGLTVQPNTDYQIRLIVKTLMTRPNLEKIARLSDLDVMTENDAEFQSALDTLKSNLKIGAANRENIFTLSYDSKSPQEAKNVVQSALDVFIENTLGETRSEADTAEQFLDRQIKEYENRLLNGEKKLTEFKQKYANNIGANVSSYYSTLSQHKSRLDEAQLQLREVNSRLASAQRQLEGEEPSFGLVQPKAQQTQISTQFDARIEQLRKQLDDLSLKYTERHPNVMELTKRIEDLEVQRAAEVAEIQKAMPANTHDETLDKNPVYQQMKINVNRLENEKASLQVRVRDYEEKVRQIEDKIHLIPEIESKLVGLNRDYEITKQKYNELLSRREQARLSQSADLTADDIQFKIIEPPRVPLHPTGPNRKLLLSIVTVFSIAAGTGLALLFSLINPTVMSGSQLTKLTNYPVFGTVSVLDNVSGRTAATNWMNLVFFGALGLALTTYAVLLFLQIKYFS